jgi:hypothetical protein
MTSLIVVAVVVAVVDVDAVAAAVAYVSEPVWVVESEKLMLGR